MGKGTYQGNEGNSGSPLQEACDYLIKNLIDAEYSDDPLAVRNVTAVIKIISTHTLMLREAPVITQMEELEKRIAIEVRQHYMNKQKDQYRDDVDNSDNWALEEDDILQQVQRIIDRHKNEIYVYSWRVSAYRDTNIPNQELLAFDANHVYDNCADEVFEYMMGFGIISGNENADTEVPDEKTVKRRYTAKSMEKLRRRN
jgi:hypothetical protein